MLQMDLSEYFWAYTYMGCIVTAMYQAANFHTEVLVRKLMKIGID